MQNQLLYFSTLEWKPLRPVIIDNDKIIYFSNDDNNIIVSDWCKNIIWLNQNKGMYNL